MNPLSNLFRKGPGDQNLSTIELGYIEHGIQGVPAISNGFSFPFDLILLNKRSDITNRCYIECSI